MKKQKTKWIGDTTCAVCAKDVREVGPWFADASIPAYGGAWGLVCSKHAIDCGVKFGRGVGQKYDSKTMEKVEG